MFIDFPFFFIASIFRPTGEDFVMFRRRGGLRNCEGHFDLFWTVFRALRTGRARKPIVRCSVRSELAATADMFGHLLLTFLKEFYLML